MNDAFTMPVENIRKGDTLDAAFGYAQVLASDSYAWRDPQAHDGWALYVFPISTIEERPGMTIEEVEPGDVDDIRQGVDYLLVRLVFDQRLTQLTVTASLPCVLDPVDMLPVRWWANVYEIDRHYGGPEEGGWWFNAGTVLQSVGCANRERAEDRAYRLRILWADENTRPISSVAYNGGQYDVVIEQTQGADYPSHRPHYE